MFPPVFLRKGVLCAASFALLSPVCVFSEDEMTSRILIGASRIDVTTDPAFSAARGRISREDLLEWVRTAAESVVAYYERFPVPLLQIRVAAFNGHRVRGGRTFGDRGGGRIIVKVGVETTAASLRSDWLLTHEMVHLAFPSVAEKHDWIEEGISTYVEPIARVKAGHLDAGQMWAEVVRDIPQGLPAAGDQGLDHTHTWGRTYWGGALFCLLADVEIRRQTQNRKGLEDALRGILNAGGDVRVHWDVERALHTGDEAAGVSVLIPLYKKMKDSAAPVDLEDLWKKLGIAIEGKRVKFDDSAPLAAARKAITASAGTVPASSFRSPASAPASTKFSAVFVGHDAGSMAPHRRYPTAGRRNAPSSK